MSDSEEKNIAPSEKKLRKARDEGQIAQYLDIKVALVTCVGIGMIWLFFGRFAAYFESNIIIAIQMIASPEYNYDEILYYSLFEGAATILPIFSVMFGVLIASSLVLNKGFILNFKSMHPKMSNIDPVNGVKRIFGVRALIEILKTVLRMVVTLTAVWFAMYYMAGDLVYVPGCGMRCLFEYFMILSVVVFVIILIIALVSAVIDIPIQSWLFTRDQKMSKTEQKNEMKDSFGSPEIRAARNKLRNEAAQQTGKAGVGHATIIIFGDDAAVGLRYVPDELPVPVLVARAKGSRVDDLLDDARYLKAPWHHDNDLAVRLASGSMVGNPISNRDFGDTAAALNAVKA